MSGREKWPWAHLHVAAVKAMCALPEWEEQEKIGAHIVRASDILHRLDKCHRNVGSDGLKRMYLTKQIPRAIALLKDCLMIPAPGAPGYWVRRSLVAEHPDRVWNPRYDVALRNHAELVDEGWTRVEGYGDDQYINLPDVNLGEWASGR